MDITILLYAFMHTPQLTDEECLELASTVRLVLSELSERLSAILKDKAELTAAISTLMHDKSS